MHPNDDALRNFKVGHEFKQGSKMFLEGNDGRVTGYHFHIEVAKGKFSSCKNNGWVKNNKNTWVLSGNTVKPEKAFWIDKNFTTIKNSKGLKFKTITAEESSEYFMVPDYKGVSIVDALKDINAASDFNYRKKIAKKNNINFYIGSSKQNLLLLSMLKDGFLLKP